MVRVIFNGKVAKTEVIEFQSYLIIHESTFTEMNRPGGQFIVKLISFVFVHVKPIKRKKTLLYCTDI